MSGWAEHQPDQVRTRRLRHPEWGWPSSDSRLRQKHSARTPAQTPGSRSNESGACDTGNRAYSWSWSATTRHQQHLGDVHLGDVPVAVRGMAAMDGCPLVGVDTPAEDYNCQDRDAERLDGPGAITDVPLPGSAQARPRSRASLAGAVRLTALRGRDLVADQEADRAYRSAEEADCPDAGDDPGRKFTGAEEVRVRAAGERAGRGGSASSRRRPGSRRRCRAALQKRICSSVSQVQVPPSGSC